MDVKKIDAILDRVAKGDTFILTRAAAKMDDEEVKQQGIDRITVFLTNQESILIVKPQSEALGYLINLRAHGAMVFDVGVKPEFELQNIAGEVTRLSIKHNGMVYWFDLYDQLMGVEVAKFLNIEISDPTK